MNGKLKLYDYSDSNACNFIFSKHHIINQLSLEYHYLTQDYNCLLILLSLVMQYVHNIAHNLAYYLTVQAPRLRDVGFILIKEIQPDSVWYSANEVVSLCLCLSFCVCIHAYIYIYICDCVSLPFLSLSHTLLIIPTALIALTILITLISLCNL